MPSRRSPKKGSFGGHFDELVKHFPNDKSSGNEQAEDHRKPPKDDGNIHDRLFESAWRKTRERRLHR